MSNPTIEVTGRARDHVDAESYRLVFEVKAEADRPSDAHARVSDRRRTVTDAVEAASERASVDVRDGFVGETMTAFDCSPDAAYVARQTVEVRCPTMDVETVIAGAVDSGVFLEDTEPLLSGTIRDAVRSELLAAAMKRAREDAERTAAAADHDVTSLESLEITDTGSFDVFGSDNGIFDAALDHETGVVEVSVTVDATYAIAPTEDAP